MALLDFQEIPQANKATGKQETFELFARDALDSMGFKVVLGPARGADGGKDLIVEETRPGLVEDTRIKWLVSCKHFAPTGESVRPDDEKNVLERVKAARCDGFLGFYSTLPSNGLSELLKKQSIPVKLFDHEEIERHLLASPPGRRLIERYFPTSAAKLRPKPAQIFDEPIPINCDHCGKNLLEPPSGIWVMWEAYDESDREKRSSKYVDFHFACKGKCDRVLASQTRARHAARGSVLDGWDDIPDMTIPTIFIRKVMALMNGLAAGDQYEPAVFDRVKSLLLATFPHISRQLNDKDREEVRRLMSIPPWA
jgi:Restriction endonuclease